jgi:hypothetical protein
MDIEEKVERLKVKKDYETAKRVAFTVSNENGKKEHSVLYSKDKKEWLCDCKWYSTGHNSIKKHCSHIMAAKNKSRL